MVALLTEEADTISASMQQQLLSTLRSNIQLPECLRVIGHLRRLAVFSEQELRLCFLQCREQWLCELVAGLHDGNAYEYLKRLTDVHRLHLFDVVMQFKAIFSDAQVCGKGGWVSLCVHFLLFYCCHFFPPPMHAQMHNYTHNPHTTTNTQQHTRAHTRRYQGKQGMVA